jgi:xanthine dehydrogenase YagS FAD-binding subunit
MLAPFSYVRPRTLGEAVEHLGEQDSRVHAGGTDLLGCLRDGVFPASKVVSLSDLPGLDRIEELADGGLAIGALVTISAVAESPVVKRRFAGLAKAASEVASPQLRNQGTIGGNLCQKPRCWYYRGEFHCLRKGGPTCFAVDGQNQFHAIFGADVCCIVHPSDPAAALLALDAEVRIRGPEGSRSVKVADFHVPPAKDVRRETVLEPGELVTGVAIPAPPDGLVSTYRKIRARRSWDFALAGLALALAFDGEGKVSHARAVLSGVAPIPWRSKALEDAIRGRRLDPPTIRTAADAAVGGAEPHSRNAYKVDLVRGIVEEELTGLA